GRAGQRNLPTDFREGEPLSPEFLRQARSRGPCGRAGQRSLQVVTESLNRAVRRKKIAILSPRLRAVPRRKPVKTLHKSSIASKSQSWRLGNASVAKQPRGAGPEGPPTTRAGQEGSMTRVIRGTLLALGLALLVPAQALANGGVCPRPPIGSDVQPPPDIYS